ncbi:MipA/OmpV family protein [[Empedobacter] haloabium]|uniref:MipA/OmpV family protein n=1 Tax=[Empedobacter] haloabium TaxID=592317 RepID=A0ABZ1UE81_9BURK
MNNKFRLIALAGLLAASAAHADDDVNVLTLAGGIAGGPRYSGADERVIGPALAIDYQMANGFYASTMRGIGYGRQLGPFDVGAALGYRGERSERDRAGLGGARGSTALHGMGTVKGSATAVLHAGYAVLDGLELTMAADLPISHRENGRTLAIGVTGTLFAQGADHVTLALAANLADSAYVRTYYGVTAAQATRTGYTPFTPKAGLYEMELGMTWQHRFNERWSVTTMAGLSVLTRDAARSPLARRDTAPTGAVFLGYRF